MARSRFAKDAGLSFRMGLTMFLNGLIYVVLILGIWWAFGGSSGGVVVAVLLSAGIFWFQWYFSDSVAMRAMGARVVTPEQAPELHSLVDRLCQQADMPKPRVAFADTRVPNAFATGRSPQHSVVCVTRGLLDRLEPKEVEAVLAHELSHVAHRDVTVMTVAGVTGVVASLMMRTFLYTGGGRSNNNNGLPVQLVLMLVGVVVYALSFFLIRVLSRYRELAADRAAALLTGSPSTLAAALVKISDSASQLPKQDLRSSAGAAHLAFFEFGSLFSTHPSLDKRLAQLDRISRQLSSEY
ncbi:zinc metalloprotease HtpX [Brevibacterium album]|uniref:zinc metalloprotease HtpX n=1 Tax=Brevibacterium album TaxID=417948 RepID=UPI000421AA29|nr:zinc metalloprotease HtpX [Brevibacterium album]